jgi:methyl coenzyme M reductase beta subunit
VDGKGGFPAILHPNETVVDHTKGQQTGAVTVNLTLQNTAQSFDPRSAAQLLTQQAGTIGKIAVASINQALNKNGRTFS